MSQTPDKIEYVCNTPEAQHVQKALIEMMVRCMKIGSPDSEILRYKQIYFLTDTYVTGMPDRRAMLVNLNVQCNRAAPSPVKFQANHRVSTMKDLLGALEPFRQRNTRKTYPVGDYRFDDLYAEIEATLLGLEDVLCTTSDLRSVVKYDLLTANPQLQQQLGIVDLEATDHIYVTLVLRGEYLLESGPDFLARLHLPGVKMVELGHSNM